jgi:hypothetical protein
VCVYILTSTTTAETGTRASFKSNQRDESTQRQRKGDREGGGTRCAATATARPEPGMPAFVSKQVSLYGQKPCSWFFWFSLADLPLVEDRELYQYEVD